MANFFDRFKKRWATSGTISEPTANQADTGFSFLGSNPPTEALFNAIHQALDEKDNWLFGQLEAIQAAAGRTPAATDAQGTLLAMRSLFGMNISVFQRDRTGVPFIVPAGVTRIRVRMLAGGAGGSGNANFQAGGGGGAGEYREGIFTVTPGNAFIVTVGAGGNGGHNSGAGGGSSAFGSIMTAVGGSGASNIVGSSGGGFGGSNGSGGDLAVPGGDGEDGATPEGTSVGSGNNLTRGGHGGASMFGGGGRAARGTNGRPGRAYGSGGGSAYGAAGFNGGPGADGIVIVEW